MPYAGRPGVSPAVATLFSLGRIRPAHRVLDVGCGSGNEALLLASWGVRDVVGIDADRRAIETAQRNARRRGLDGRVRFLRRRAQDLARTFPPRTFDVVLHTLVANNPSGATEWHFRNVRAVMKRRGLLVVQERVSPREAARSPGQVAPVPALERYFRLTPGVPTHLPERRQTKRSPDYAGIVLWLGRPR